MSKVFTYFAYKNITHFPFSHHLITYINPTRMCPRFYMVAALVYNLLIFPKNVNNYNAKSLWLVSLSDSAKFEISLQRLWLLASSAHDLPATEQNQILLLFSNIQI